MIFAVAMPVSPVGAHSRPRGQSDQYWRLLAVCHV